MSSLSPKDRASLCTFTFSDGRRCRTPRNRNNARFCFYHAQKEARARAAEKLGKDLAYFFSGDYLSACDLSTALGRLIPAVLRRDVKPRTARTVAYLAQTTMQAIHLSKHEYIHAFAADAWRQSVPNSVNYTHYHLHPRTHSPPLPPSPRSHIQHLPCLSRSGWVCGAKYPTLITPHRPPTRRIPSPQPKPLSSLHHPPRGKNLGQRLARRQVHPAFPF